MCTQNERNTNDNQIDYSIGLFIYKSCFLEFLRDLVIFFCSGTYSYYEWEGGEVGVYEAERKEERIKRKFYMPNTKS